LTTDEEIAACAARIVRVRDLYTSPPLLLGRARIDLSRLWDAVALWVAIQGCREAGWPWPVWIHDLIPADE
jgi:hypothetical protein